MLSQTDKSYQSAIEDAQAGTRLLRRMAVATFVIGNATIVVALIMEFFYQREVWSKLMGGIGVTELIATFVIAPRKNMKADGADFSQFMLIYTGFMETVVSLRPLMRQNATLAQRLRAIKALNAAKAEALDQIELYLEPTSQDELRKMLIAKYSGGTAAASGKGKASGGG